MLNSSSPTPDVSALEPEQLLRLLEVSAYLNSADNTGQLLPFIIRTAAEVLHCDAASLLLYDDEAEQLRFAAATGADPEVLAHIPVPLEGSIAGTIFRENRAVRIESAEEDERHYGGVDEQADFHTRDLLGVPMHVEGQVVGVLEALNKSRSAETSGFSDEDEMVLCIIADQAAVAIRTARQVQALREAHDRLARMEAMKSRFLTLASHELRTPLTAIKGFAEIISEEAANAAPPLDETAEHAAVILQETDTMSAVLDAMGEMNMLRTGADAFSPRRMPVQDAITAASDAVSDLVAEKHLTLTVQPTEAPLFVRADAVKLATALTNLLDNAARFTSSGGQITLRAQAERGGVLVEVADTGCGLAAEHLDAVFSDFFQVEDALTRTHGGLGLGLTIARGIIEIHGGRLWAESDGLRQGATFCLWLPSASLQPIAAAPPLSADVVSVRAA